MSSFGPKNEREVEVFSATSLITRVQYEIEKAMKQQGLSQKDLAARLSVSPSRVNQMLNDNGNMTLRTLARIRHFLGLDLGCLADGGDNQYGARYSGVHPILLRQKRHDETSVRQVIMMLKHRPGSQGLAPEAVNENGFRGLVPSAVKAVA